MRCDVLRILETIYGYRDVLMSLLRAGLCFWVWRAWGWVADSYFGRGDFEENVAILGRILRGELT